jgi:hypothetical protein
MLTVPADVSQARAKHAKVKWDDAMKASYEALAAGGE